MNQLKRPLIIAHRGSSAIAPENTLASFTQALDDNSDGVEFDVRLARDGVPVVFHDAGLKRLADIDTSISSLNADQLSKFDIGSWFNREHPELARPEFSNERISTLSEVLRFLKNFTGTVYVELKSTQRNKRRLAEAVGEILCEKTGLFNVIVKSFILETVPIVKSICSDIETAALFAPTIKRMLQKEKNLVTLAADMEFDRLSLHYSLATKKLMRLASEVNMPVTIWTADSPLWIRRATELGIDSLITNDPARLLAKRNQLIPKAA
jgi:glycerophosphoryl diester phosphodiesterase